MRIVVVGSGPTGLFLGTALARRGHAVVSVDRDPGPLTADDWSRRGVMQFDHAHAFRPQVALALEDEWPEALAQWLALGAEPVEVPNPASSRRVTVMRSRRSTYERALRCAARNEPGLSLLTGHAGGLVVDHGRVTGVRVDGSVVAADLVVDATGRAGRVPGSRTAERDHERGPEDPGMSLVDRTYRLHPGAEPGPMGNPMAWIADLDGYQCRVFLHERGYFTAVVLRRTADLELAALRHDAVFDAACRAVPGVSDWVDPDRAAPVTHALAGSGLRNVYRPQSGTPGLVAVGDAVSTTTPTRGRGIAMASVQVLALLELLDDGAEPLSVAEPFGAWCDAEVQPWVTDHVAIDGGTVRRWEGQDIDLEKPLTPDLIAEAVQVDQRIAPLAVPYFSMTALPETLRPAEPMARAVYERGWRPPLAAGPTRDELVEVIERSMAAA